MISWILSPIGRWASGIAALFTAVMTIYLKGRSEGKDAIRREQEEERNRRAGNAIEADNRVRRDNAAGRLYENDGHRRD